jgi:aldose 1-epimerase
MRSFGLLSDGRRVEAITLRNGSGLELEVLTYGAILRRLSYPVRGVRRELILNFDRLEHYERDRVRRPYRARGNRNANSAFSIDGHKHKVTANEGGTPAWRVGLRQAPVALAGSRRRRHPGATRLRLIRWRIGYPGELETTVEFNGPDTLDRDHGAQRRADAREPHLSPLFNLSGNFAAPVLDHSRASRLRTIYQ